MFQPGMPAAGPTKAPIDCGPLQLLDPRLFPNALPLRDLARNMGFELMGGRAAGQRTQIKDLFGDALAVFCTIAGAVPAGKASPYQLVTS